MYTGHLQGYYEIRVDGIDGSGAATTFKWRGCFAGVFEPSAVPS
eukprot:COSAG02_NODE_21547_length_784_cov_0.724088_1_plen_43_part_10